MANVDAVPARRYGKAAPTALGRLERLEAKVAQCGECARPANSLYAHSEAPSAIVYQKNRCDRRARRCGSSASIPEDIPHPPIIDRLLHIYAGRPARCGERIPQPSCSRRRPELFEPQGFEFLVRVRSELS